MIVSAAVDPACFGPDAIADGASREQAEQLLKCAIQNMVILIDSASGFHEAITSHMQMLNIRLRQQLEILWADVRKTGKRWYACPHMACQGGGRSSADQLRDLATSLLADAVICATEENVPSLADLSHRGVEVVVLAQFSRSKIEAQRRTYLEGRRLDSIGAEEASKLVGRAVKYARRVVFADRMIGPVTKIAPERNSRFARGVMYVVAQWNKHSPFAGVDKLEVCVVSVAGEAGARAGYVDPTETKQKIEEALRREDRTRVVGQAIVELKQDNNPSIFKDRFIEARKRCWGVRHGIDDLGSLGGSQPYRTPTFIDPHSDDNLDLLAAIKALPAAR